jgi:hypothetical protein
VNYSREFIKKGPTKSHKPSAGISGIWTKTRTGSFPNAIRKNYRLSQLSRFIACICAQFHVTYLREVELDNLSHKALLESLSQVPVPWYIAVED